MHSTPEQRFQDGVRRAAVKALGFEPTSIPLSYPPSAAQGDLASPVCFELARAARRAPRALAEALVAVFETGDGIARVEVAGGGYINAFLDRGAFLKRWLVEERCAAAAGPKVIVEHTNINPNKAAHIGHLRNAVLGDTLVRCLRQLGRRVEVQNYIDDTGVQVADLVVGFRVLRGEELGRVLERYDEAALRERKERFDFVAWNLYSEVTRFYEADPSRKRHREETQLAMEAGDNPVAELAAHLSRRMVRHHLETMDRVGIRYDLLPKESDILALRFWQDAFRRLRDSGAIRLARDGRHAGCWVMDLPGVERGSGEDEKIIVRSNGIVTYVGKDIAYQMWKFGLLGRDFRYVPFDWAGSPPLYPIWETHSLGADDHPSFGAGSEVYNVIDSSQAYLQRVVTLGLRSLGHGAEADRSIHFSYEKVALSPAAVTTMFPDYPLTEQDRAKPHIEMKGRMGLGVRADDLIDALLDRASAEVRARNADFTEGRIRDTAHKIAVGALRYYLLRFSRNRVVAFDLDDALAFEGETGPYLQYSVVRARNILGKVAERHGSQETDPAFLSAHLELSALPGDTLAEHWNLALLVSRVQSAVGQAVESLELSTLAKHGYVLAQAFNSFYHKYPVAQEEDPAVRRVRSALVRVYHDGMVHFLGLMGIEVPDRM